MAAHIESRPTGKQPWIDHGNPDLARHWNASLPPSLHSSLEEVYDSTLFLLAPRSLRFFPLESIFGRVTIAFSATSAKKKKKLE